jgi:hypothetical protein
MEAFDGKFPEARARRQRGSVADLLDGCHQGKREQGGPQKRQAELGSGLGVGGDPGWIIIGCARDQARPKRP